ncbi:class I SAM-dependent methyltransferase [Paenibacillus rigui]|uniref:Methyltransferase type 11 domain-containing protein n=1 Tax=Paenibacillus rigui TaxID=554312 RepID=A0A229USP4_9BACL|nr:class I SAM-dependent methyltransferase [Paenibacillus rigui]OXM86353.1 hypothetical protein CF651_10490 [Paenibacillus rigui]
MDLITAGQQSVKEIVQKIDAGIDVAENAQELTGMLKENDRVLDSLLLAIERTSQGVEICNLLAVTSFENGVHDAILPLLQKALGIKSDDKDTLMNLSLFLAEYGELELALDYAQRITDQSADVVEQIQHLSNKLDDAAKENEFDILNLEQNDVAFTGERLVINQEVKQRFNNVLEEHLNRYKLAAEYVQGKVVLDAACGAGYGSMMLKQAGAQMVLGVDVSEESLQHARKDYFAENVDFQYGDVNKLAFDDSSFDVVVSFETIEHIEDGSKWIRESARLLKEDGLFLVSTPNRMVTNPGTYFVEQPLNPHHRYEYSVNEFVGELLKEYEILEIYGQTYSNDHELFYSQIMRQARKMNAEFVPSTASKRNGHELIPLGDVKDAQPMYVIAVCRKKR